MHITFDLETLGNTTTAPITQIAAVKFNEKGDILGEFSRSIKLSSLTRYDFSVEFDTLQWWFQQDDAAIKAVFCDDDAVDIRQALREFYEWIGKHADYRYWSHSTFDPPILIYNTLKVGLPKMIPFRLFIDIRTLVYFTGMYDTLFKGTAHVALDDCKYQADYISQALTDLRECGYPNENLIINQQTDAVI